MRLELGEDERRALVDRQPLHVGQQRTQVVALLDLLGEPGRRGQDRLDVVERDLLAPCGEHRQAAVAGDGVQPGAQRDRAIVGQERAVRGAEGVLDRVLGLLQRPEHVPAEGQHAAVMAVVEDLEGGACGGAVTAADLRDEPIVACLAQRAPR